MIVYVRDRDTTGHMDPTTASLKSIKKWYVYIPPKPLFNFQFHPQILLCKKKIPHHIKISANAWSTKCR
jgi:hypothetical protein